MTERIPVYPAIIGDRKARRGNGRDGTPWPTVTSAVPQSGRDLPQSGWRGGAPWPGEPSPAVPATRRPRRPGRRLSSGHPRGEADKGIIPELRSCGSPGREGAMWAEAMRASVRSVTIRCLVVLEGYPE